MIKNKKIVAELLLLTVAAGWGIGFPVMKLAINEYPVATVLALRFILAAILLFPFAMKDLSKIETKTLFSGIFLGFLLSLSFIFLIFGLELTTASSTGFLAGLSVIWVLILTSIIAYKLPSLDIVIATLLGLIGIYVMSDMQGWVLQKGELLVILGSLFTAIHIIAIDKIQSQQQNSVVLTILQLITTAVVMTCVVHFTGHNIIPTTWNFNLITALFITAIFSTTIAFWVQTNYQSYTTPNRAVLIYNLEPVFAAIFAMWLLQEQLHFNMIVGGFLILVGMCLPVFIKQNRLLT